MCLLSSVACLYRSLRNEHIWFLYLNLKVVSQSPMYVSFVVEVVTSAFLLVMTAIVYCSIFSNIFDCNRYFWQSPDDCFA